MVPTTGVWCRIEANVLALPERVYVCPILFIIEILMLQLHANSIDNKNVCVPPNPFPLLLIAAAWGQSIKYRREETG